MELEQDLLTPKSSTSSKSLSREFFSVRQYCGEAARAHSPVTHPLQEQPCPCDFERYLTSLCL
jgi:hypothetical protein